MVVFFLLIINCTQSIKRVQVGKNVKIVKKSEPLYFFKNASHVVKKKILSETRARAQHLSHLIYQMRP